MGVYDKTVYKVHEKLHLIIERNLADVIRDNAEQTTSPRGVEAKLHIVECKDGGYELRLWECNGSSKHVCYCDTREEADEEWLQRTYDYDFIDSEDYYDYCESREEAIAYFQERYREEHSVEAWEEADLDGAAIITKATSEYNEDIERIANNLEENLRNAYGDGKVITKKCKKAAERILHYGEHYKGDFYFFISYHSIVSRDTLLLAAKVLGIEDIDKTIESWTK